MTTDAFTTAASERALGIAMETFKPGFDPENHPSVYRLLCDMAEWARDHLARQEVTDAAVEAALNAHMNVATGDRDLPLDAYGALDIEAMRAALTAAHSVLTVYSEAVTVESDEPTDAEVEAAAEVWQAHSRLAHPVEGTEPSCEECGYAFGWSGISESEEGKRYREHVARAALTAAKGARA